MAMSLMEILRESLKIPLRNGKLMLSIALLLLIPSSLLFLSNHFTLKPSLIDAFTKAYIVRNTDLEPPEIGLVVSVVEKDCYGMEAIWKAGALMKGRTLQGFCLSLVLTLVEMVISGFLGFEMGGVGKTEAARLGLGLALISATGLVDLFVCVVYTVFYCDCKNGLGEKVEIEREEGAGYSLISTNCHVDTSIL
ncbi:hypothetical protein CKAN_02049200 [Cinnamomum micranthum f. kanehirae]|uniref:Uncharacterized protein n=1 Tax=Cinnamomum micranthum f. kanehirae TaxID=337451 RepID=A0A3S3N309_9MAGN|nr:hypothetical protein CKAN_02049200 [Cinnamomum micranthum f. kanehirae]